MTVLILAPIIAILVFYFGFKRYLSPPTRWCRSNRCLVGKTALITGANTGIGFQVALKLASRGAKVILACRSEERGEAARRKIVEETDNENVFVRIVDFSSFRSVRSFAKELDESEGRLDILVNNAGVVFGYNEQTEDGLDSVMQINHYSQFLVTVLLLGLMRKSGEASRIVNTSSLAAKYAKNFDVDKIGNYTGNLDAYANSKLCNILFTKELAKRVGSSNVTAYSVHPGTIKSDLFRSTKGSHKRIMQLIINLFYKPTEEGAETTVYCAVEKGLEKYNGHHFDNCRRVGDYDTAKREGLPKRLWEVTEEIVGLKQDEKVHLDF